ncbi:MAG: T9SS type A sorting domain-containing protein [Sphingobacteriales bacterium]|nr:MAG: T9SS type A sorting domain-containing protein [Sphingobacteriales bacterium]
MGVAASVVNPAGSVVTQTVTSYATPVLAGLTACLMQSAPNLHPMQLRSLIESVSDSFATPTNNIGNGVPDFKKAYNLTGIPGLSRVQDAFNIYPNPADNSVFISTKNDTGNLQYAVYDLQGRCALQGSTRSDKAVDVSQLSEGIYFLKVNNGKVFQAGKLIIR